MGVILGMQGYFDIQTSFNAIHHRNKLNKRNYFVISINTEKASDKIKYPFLVKILSKLELKETSSTHG